MRSVLRCDLRHPENKMRLHVWGVMSPERRELSETGNSNIWCISELLAFFSDRKTLCSLVGYVEIVVSLFLHCATPESMFVVDEFFAKVLPETPPRSEISWVSVVCTKCHHKLQHLNRISGSWLEGEGGRAALMRVRKISRIFEEKEKRKWEVFGLISLCDFFLSIRHQRSTVLR